MTSFPAAARRVRAEDLPIRDRFLALRECALCFGPYGFRATWHHLMVSARVPQRLEADVDSLVRAVRELEEARGLWLEWTRAYEERRRQEKAAGRRTPSASDYRYGWGVLLAYCPDPTRHPSERLATVVRRLLDTHGAGACPSVCRACGHGRSLVEICPGCGVDPRGPAARSSAELRSRAAYQWFHIWNRTGFLDTSQS